MKQQVFSAVALIFAVFLLTACSGCGSKRPQTAPVQGRVAYQGKPVVAGTIAFQPEHGRQAIGHIQADGTYKLTTFDAGDGALLGRHRVTIEARRVPKPPPMEGPGSGSPMPSVEWLVPRKYADPASSPLTAEVKPGNNTIDFDLPSEPGGNP